MNNPRYLLDTCTVIFLTAKGSRIPAGLEEELDKSDLFISAVTEIELLSNKALLPDDEKKLRVLISERLNVIDLSEAIKNEVIALRRCTELTFPDSIIAATAIVHNAVLLTSDTVLLRINRPGYKTRKL